MKGKWLNKFVKCMVGDNQEMQLRQQLETIKCEKNPLKKFKGYIKLLQERMPRNASLQLVKAEELGERELEVWLEFVRRLNKVLVLVDSDEAYKQVAWQEVLNCDGIDSCRENFQHWLKNQLTIIESTTQELAAGKKKLFLALRELVEGQKQDLFISEIYS